MTVVNEEAGRPAATLIVISDKPNGAPQILMVERALTMAFAPGALVFPGGGVDAADVAMAARLGARDVEESAARIAAIRETVEEAGLAIGIRNSDAAVALRLRDGLANGHAFADLLDQHGLTLDLDTLTPFARWHPAPFDNARRIYDTRFYLAKAPAAQLASVDTTENVSLFWATAIEVLKRAKAGEGRLVYPTRRNLERLAQYADHAALVAHAKETPVEKIRPWIEEREGKPHLCIPKHLGYPITAEPMERAVRG